jgi:integrase
MGIYGHNPDAAALAKRGIVVPETNFGDPLEGDFERMARRRFQNPKPFREGNWWWINPWQDVIKEGRLTRKRKRMKVAPATLSDREAKKIAAEMLRPMNQGLECIGSAMLFGAYIEGTYRSAALPLLASTTRDNYEYVLGRYLLPMFSNTSLRDLSTLTLQRYFSSLKVSHTSASKIRDVLASVMGSAVRFGVVVKNPLTGVQLVPSRTGKKTKPTITPEQFHELVDLIAEPYSTMVYSCVLTGLRISELLALKWEDVHLDSITIDERYCRGDWACPKTNASGATIGVDESVIQRIQRLKDMEVTINWGARGAQKTFKLVSSDAPHDLVFQSLRKGAPMSDHNILTRHLKPAGRKLGIGYVNWQVLRRSYATWLVQAGADPKAVQGLMRHSRIGTTMDIYAQFVPESQRRAVVQMTEMVNGRQKKAAEAKSAAIN